MEKYTVNFISQDEKLFLITLLDYEIKISKFLDEIKILPLLSKEALIDTALVGGMNEYRFIDADSSQYVNVSEYIVNQANAVLLKNKNALENSILTREQKDKIVNSIWK